MPAEKSVSVSFRVSPTFKKLLVLAAEREHRSQTNLLETLLFAHCNKAGIYVDDEDVPAPKTIPGTV
ncbi:MAG TPA: hypothetical protein VFF81_08505 [Noviherbaspirillum sp.]|nr:hypothetical protein [Noviherbaspirillum sp.]